ncbi:MAG: 50S ribosomal protein L23 [Chthoniobacteraceae bacterium]
MNEPHDIIQTICLTEKAMRHTESENKYVFRVRPWATKPQIKHAIETLFKKKVVKVNTMVFPGKARRQRTAAAGFTSDWKKAIVQLAEGEKIELA